MKETKGIFRCQSVFAMAVLATTPVLGQQPNIRSVHFFNVKWDRIGDFQTASKENIAVLKKAGADSYFSAWVSLTGPVAEYVYVDNFTKWADADYHPDPKLKDQLANLTSIAARISQCVESSHKVIEEVLSEYSLPSTGETPKMIRTLQTKVRPDKVNEYLALWKSEVLPAAKKSGLNFFSLAQVRYGAPSTEFVSVAGLNSWADLDGGFGVEKAMGKEGYQSFLARIRPFIVESEYKLYRFLPDLSYLPAPAGK